jgi:serine/threonine protein phosphatase 1
MRTIVIGDIHGCYEELMQLLNNLELTPADCLISLGDIVDRGSDSVKVYDFLKNRPNTIVLMGNHERKHLRQTLSYSQEIVKLQFGDRYPEFLAWVDSLPYYYETDEAILVHAAVENDLEIEFQRQEVLCGCTAGEKYLEKQYGATYWHQIYTGKKTIVFGHHVVGYEPLITDRRVYGIDTGACHGGRLTALILPSFEIVQVQAATDYWRSEIVKWQVPVMRAKPWGKYKWAKIAAICEEYRNTSNPELAAFITEVARWTKDILDLASILILKVEQELAKLIDIYGANGFKKQVANLSYAALIYQANSSKVTPEFLQQTLTTPEKWLQVAMDLAIDIQEIKKELTRS